MAIVANTDIEKLKKNSSFEDIDLGILDSIYKLKKGHKFGEEGLKKKIKFNQKMADGSPTTIDSLSSTQNNNSQSSSPINTSSKLNNSTIDSNQSNSQSIESTKTSLTIKNSVIKQETNNNSILKLNNNNHKNLLSDSKPPSPLISDNENSPNKQINLNQSSSKNVLTISPPLSTTSNKFSIANILNEDPETIDTIKRNQSVSLTQNSNQLLTSNMLLNQNDIAAISSLNLIAWQASYAAQHAQAGNFFLIFPFLNL